MARGKNSSENVKDSSASSSSQHTEATTLMQGLPLHHKQEIEELISRALRKEIEVRDKKILDLEGSVKMLQDEVASLKNKLVDQEEKAEFMLQDRHKDVMVLTGNVPLCIANEDCNKIVQSTLQEKLSLRVPVTDIQKASRIGPPKPSGPDNRPIRFVLNPAQKRDIIGACIQKKPDVHVNEYLTPYKNKLYFRARQAKRELQEVIKSCYVSDGVIIIKQANKSNVKIRTESDLNRYLESVRINPVLPITTRDG